MNENERTRRQTLWERHLLMGEPRDTVVAELATEYDVDEATIEEDLETIIEWLPKLDPLREVGGVAALAELRANRQHLHELAHHARKAGDITEERKIREEINDSLNLERRLRESSTNVVRTDSDIELDKFLR